MHKRAFLALSAVLALGIGCGDDDGMTDGGMDAGVDGDIPDGMTDGMVDAGGDGSVPPLFEDPVITMCPNDGLPPLSDGVCEVTAGSSAMLITGDILTPGEVFRGGQILVDDAGMIACVGCDCSGPGAGATTVVCPDGVVSPGLINGHDHITFGNGRPYGEPQDDQFTEERYEHRNEWRRGLDGHFRINSHGGSASTEEMQFLELRQLMSGTTSIFGSGGPAGLLRNLDSATGRQEGLMQPDADYQTFPLGDSGNGDQRRTDGDCGYDFRDDAASIADEDAFVPHVAEGISDAARNEFICIREGAQDLVAPQSAFIHGVGLLAGDIAEMSAEQVELIWSPRTNITLYGDTARVSLYARMGVTIGLGTDWIPTGSATMLRELQCADSFNQNHLSGFFPDEQLWLMATRNTAQAMAMDDAVGELREGLVADIAIFDASEFADHRAVIMAEQSDVALVLRGGTALYGDGAIIDALTSGCDTVDVCGNGKRVCLQELGTTLAALVTANGCAAPDNCDDDATYGLVWCGVPADEPSCLPERNHMGGEFPDAMVNGSNYYTGMSTPTDMDGDGIMDADDNCVSIFNPIRPLDNGSQADFDDDGVGDACDACPVGGDDDPANCISVDPNDRDGDGVPNDDDNCPDDPNEDQADTDMDDKGNVCDACPEAPNPGMQGCATTVYAIRQGTAPEGRVSLAGLVVTGIASDGFYAQQREGTDDYDGVDFSGIYVFTGSAPTVSRGDTVDVTGADYLERFDRTELEMVMFTTTAGAEPTALVVAPADIATGGSRAEALESVLVRVENVTVTSDNPDAPMGPFGEFAVDDDLRIDDEMFLVAPFPSVGEMFGAITGPLGYSFMNTKVRPRDIADVVPDGLRLSAPARVRTGATFEVTVQIPDAAPAGGADVTLTFAPATLVTEVAPWVITIPEGMTTFSAMYTASATAATGTVSAMYMADTVMASLEIADAVGGGMILSEYIEGSSNNKAWEIYNGGASSVDLSACTLRLYRNGGTTATDIALSGTLASTETHVICNSSFSMPGLCDQTSGSLNHNGDDAFDLVCDGMVLDSFGDTLGDPGDAWTGGGISTQNETLRRKCTVTEGDTDLSDAFDPSVEWDGFPIDTFDNLGSHC